MAGSVLIGQPFTSPGYFWGRPSATSPVPYNARLSSGSNLGPSNPALTSVVKARAEALRESDPANPLSLPVDLVTASGSGLDPHISVAAANYQVYRVARERNLSEADVQALVNSRIEPRQFWIFGEPRVNVLMLNLALDTMAVNHVIPSSAIQPDLTLPDEPGLRFPDWIVLVLFFGVFVLTVVPLGRFMVKVIKGEPHIFSPLTVPLEHRLLTWSQVKADDEMDWKTFAIAMTVFSLIGIIFLFVLQLAQPVLPLNPAGVGSPSWDLALNTAVSFVTNTNWQAYAGETGVSYLTQMVGLCVQNFVSAATGMAVLVGLTYGLSTEVIIHYRQLLGAAHPQCHNSPPDQFHHRARTCIAGYGPDFERTGHRTTSRSGAGCERCPGDNPDNPTGSRSIPDCNQTAWRKRWGFLQHELSSPV